jgi:hypothetical protein
MLAACGTLAPNPQPTPPVGPPVPDGWRVVTSDVEDISLTVPRDLIVTSTSGSIGGYREATGERDDLIVLVTHPTRVEQRMPGESVTDWVQRGNWLTAGRGEPRIVAQREVLLPAGSALEITAGFQFGEEDRWTMLHVIDTEEGYAVIQFDGGGTTPEEPSAEIRAIRESVEFGP